MQYVKITLDDAKAIYRSASDVRDALASLEVVDQDQLALPIPGTDQALDAAMDERDQLNQAIAAHMAERDELKREVAAGRALLEAVCDSALENVATLKREVRNVSDKVHRQRGAINGKDREIANLEDMLVQSARYHLMLAERLAAIGVSFSTNDEGLPDITVNIVELSNAMDRHFARA